MKFFIDTAEFEEIKAAYKLGFVDGVTTNPSLIVKSKRNLQEVIKEIAALVEGPVSAEVIASPHNRYETRNVIATNTRRNYITIGFCSG